MKIIVTGVAGFIGFHLSKALLNEGYEIIGIDNINNYYSTKLKENRLEILNNISKNFTFYKADFSDDKIISEIFSAHKNAELVIHLGAQAGVRYSLENPLAYANSNLLGQVVIFNNANKFLSNLSKIIYASSSSVYGNQQKTPFSITDNVDNPVSLYAATKKSCELVAESFSHTHNINSIGLRFFTVYGEYGRPDMAYWSFSQNILENKPIKLFNEGNLERDFTYIDDIINGILGVIKLSNNQNKKHRIYNLGNNKPVKLKYFVEILEKNLGKKAIIELAPMQKGDVYKTFADIKESQNDFNYNPQTSIEVGLEKFTSWFRHQ